MTTTPPLTDGATYIEVLMLQHLSDRDRALHIGRAMVTPLLQCAADLDYAQRLRFFTALTAYVLGVAQSELDPAGRDAIVQTLRNVPASDHWAGAQGSVQ